MGDKRPIICRACERPVSPTTLGRSDYARRLPMCADCEEQALQDVRPSPRDRKAKGYTQR